MGGAVPKTLQSPGLPAPEGSCCPSVWVTVAVCPRPRVPFICKDLSTYLTCWRADFLPPHAHCTPERLLEPLSPCMTTDCWLSPSLPGDCVPLQSEDNCFVPVSPAHRPMPVTGQVLCKHLVNLQFKVTIYHPPHPCFDSDPYEQQVRYTRRTVTLGQPFLLSLDPNLCNTGLVGVDGI